MTDRPSAGLRSHLDKWWLRWQARLDTDNVDRWMPWALAAISFLAFSALALARARTLLNGADLGAGVQATWLVTESEPVHVTINGSHALADQASFAFYPFAWLAGRLSTIPTLLVVQSAALAVGVVPLWRLARKVTDLRVGSALVLAFAYSLYPPLHALNVSGFHTGSIAVPALLGATLFALTSKWWRYWACVVVAVACRADLALVVAVMGLVIVLPRNRRHGMATAVAGFGWVGLALLVIQPYYGDGFVHADAFMAYGDSALGAVGGMLSHPLQVLGDIFSEANFALLVGLFAPVFFLPFVAPRYLLPAIPLELLYLVGNGAESRAPRPEHAVAITAFTFVASTFALQRIGIRSIERVNVDGRMLAALALAATIFFVQDSPSSPYQQPWDWWVRDDADTARLATVELIDDGAAVRASPSLLPLLAERTEIYELDTTGNPAVRRAASDVDWIVLDDVATEDWDDDDRRLFQEGLDQLGFSEVSAVQGISVYRLR